VTGGEVRRHDGEERRSFAARLHRFPAHWRVWKVAHAFGAIGSGTTPPSNEEQWYGEDEIAWVTTSELREGVIAKTAKCVTKAALKEFSALKVHPSGSLVVALYGATIGRLGILGIDAATNQACCVLAGPRDLEIRFVFYWLQAFRQVIIDLNATGGGQPNISQDVVSSLRVPAPPRAEQLAIAAFLDRKTARIDALIEKKRRLIELLQEKRTALIVQTLTHGASNDGRTSAAAYSADGDPLDLGAGWLEAAPRDWTISRLGWHVDLLTGFPFKSELFAFDDGTRLVRGDNVTEGELRWGEKARLWSESTQGLQRYFLRGGDVLIGMDGSKVGRNFAMVAPEALPLLLVQRVARLRVKASMDCRFLYYLVGSSFFRNWVGLVRTDPAIPHISPYDIRNFPVALPPLAEQRVIAERLDRLLGAIDAAMGKVKEACEQLLEYRSALISAAVTGQIDVREAA
jgi:type I restriction enzyme, S subunit